MIEKIKDDIHNFKYPIIIVVVYLFFMQVVFKTLCPIKAFFGINCPGCGLTHATIYLITGRIKEAIDANFTVFFWWIGIILLAFNRYIHKLKFKIIPVYFIIIGIMTIARYIYIIIS